MLNISFSLSFAIIGCSTFRVYTYILTSEELKAFFRKNDFSTARYYNDDELSDEQAEEINEVGQVFKKQWNELAPQKGLKSGAANYGDDNPLIQMRDNMAQLIGEGVYKLVNEHPEKVNEILSSFQDELFDPEKADLLFNKSVDTLMNVADFESLASIIQETPAKEDFNPIPNNHRAQDWTYVNTLDKKSGIAFRLFLSKVLT